MPGPMTKSSVNAIRVRDGDSGLSVKAEALSVSVIGRNKNGWRIASYLSQFSKSKMGRQ